MDFFRYNIDLDADGMCHFSRQLRRRTTINDRIERRRIVFQPFFIDRLEASLRLVQENS